MMTYLDQSHHLTQQNAQINKNSIANHIFQDNKMPKTSIQNIETNDILHDDMIKASRYCVVQSHLSTQQQPKNKCNRNYFTRQQHSWRVSSDTHYTWWTTTSHLSMENNKHLDVKHSRDKQQQNIAKTNGWSPWQQNTSSMIA